MIAHVCAAMGWTWDYVAEHIDLPRMQHLNDYWLHHPPIHILIAQYVGYKPPQGKLNNDMQSEDEAINMLGGNTLSEGEFNELLKAKGIL